MGERNLYENRSDNISVVESPAMSSPDSDLLRGSKRENFFGREMVAHLSVMPLTKTGSFKCDAK